MDKEKLEKAWQAIMADYGNNASIALFFPQSGEEVATTNSPSLRYETASTVKVAVLALLLRKTAGKLDPTQETLTKLMIRYSDNNATTTIVKDYLGGMLALQEIYDDLGMDQTTADEWWGKTLTVPTDQLKLLKMIYCNSPRDYLNEQSREYIKHLMATVSVDQQWGISAGSSHYYLKNGWRPASDNGKWEVHSIGYLPDNGCLMAIYTRNNRDYSSGVQLIEDLARATKKLI